MPLVLKRFTVLAVALGVASACTASPELQPTGSLGPTPPADTPLPPPPTSPPPAEGACPVGAGLASLPPLATLPGLITDTLRFINDGGALDDLLVHLEAGAWLSTRENSLAVQDFTGDGWTDIALALQDPTSQLVTRPGVLLILTCTGDGYRLAYTSPHLDDRGGPLIHAAQDLTGDGQPELLVGQMTCGAHTCFEHLKVLQWQGSSFENRLRGSSNDLPSPALTLLGPRASGAMDIVVTGTGYGSVGAGPYRPRTRTWAWDPAAEAFTVSGEVLGPTNFRIHRLLEGDAAFQARDYTTALDLYRQVAIDDTLDDWIPGPEAGHNLRAYATFRRILAYLLLQDLGDAQVVYGILQGGYPAGSIGHAYAELATAFWDTYQATGSMAEGCRAAQGFAASHASEVLDPLAYGYTNPSYGAQDVCPIAP
jgi:hypothetical protein